jgi:hypothetical protein
MERNCIVTESGIYIDTSSVPTLNESETEEFSKVLKIITEKVSSADLLHEVAVHEAGHIIQFALQGINRTNLYGPTIRCRQGEQDCPFYGFPAAVKETKAAKKVANSVDGVQLLAKRCVSGGVATHIVFGHEFEDIEDEMSDDHDQFEKMCNTAETTMKPPVEIDSSALWTATLSKVAKTYKARQSIRTEILTVADRVEEAIRAWRGDVPIPISCDVLPT